METSLDLEPAVGSIGDNLGLGKAYGVGGWG